MNGVPLRPTGTNAFSYYVQRVWDRCFGVEGQIQSTSTIIAQNTSRGIFLHAKPKPIGSGGGGLTCHVLISVPSNQDYVIAKTYNPETNTVGSTNVYIAKNLETRTISIERIAGEVWSYDYPVGLGADSDNQYRIAYYGSVTETQVVVPYWIPYSEELPTSSCLVWSIECDHTGVTLALEGQPERELTQMLVTSRCWAKRA